MKMIKILIKKDILKIMHFLGLDKFEQSFIQKIIIFLIILTVLFSFLIYYFYKIFSIVIMNSNINECFNLVKVIISSLLLFIDIYWLHELTDSKEFKLINSFPLKKIVIVLSKLLLVYIVNIIIELLIALPLAMLIANNYKALLGLILLIFSIPIYILFITSIIVFLSKSQRRFKKYSICKSIFLVVSLNFILIIIFKIDIKNSNLFNYIILLFTDIGFIDLIGSNWTFFIGFLSIPIFIYSTLIITTKCIERNSVQGKIANEKKNKTKVVSSGKLKTLFKEELHRYVVTTPYILNTLSILLLLLFTSITIFLSRYGFKSLVSIPKGFIKSNIFVFPYMISLISGMSSTTQISFSVEGGCIWMKKAFPISSMHIYLSKILVCLTFSIPLTIFSALLLMLNGEILFLDKLYVLLILVLNNIFSAMLGIFIDINFGKYDWDNIIAVIKRSLSSILFQISNFIIMIIFIIIKTKYKYSFWLSLVPIILTIFFILGLSIYLFNRDIAER